MEKNKKNAAARVVALKSFLVKHKKPVVITISVLLLQVLFGFDPKFCIINLIWLTM